MHSKETIKTGFELNTLDKYETEELGFMVQSNDLRLVKTINHDRLSFLLVSTSSLFGLSVHLMDLLADGAGLDGCHVFMVNAVLLHYWSAHLDRQFSDWVETKEK